MKRYRFAGLTDAPRAGQPRTILDEQVQAIVDKVRQTKPENATYWSVRSMSAAKGVSAPTVHRRDAQDRESACLVRGAAALPRALHADLGVLA